MSPRHADPPIANGDQDDLPEDLVPLAERLRASRPVLTTAARYRILDRLGAMHVHPPDRAHTRNLIALFATTGTLLLALGALVTFL